MNGSAQKDFVWVCNLLKEIHIKSNNKWSTFKNLSGSKLDSPTLDNFSNVKEFKNPMKYEELEYLIKNAQESKNLSLHLNKNLYLPPLEYNSEFIPILFLDCDLNKSDPDVSFKINLFRSIIEENTIKLQYFGVRFEIHGPESPHGYYHFQVTHAHSPGCPDWVPNTLPCIPIRCKCPVSLLLCMLISFYGKGMFNKLFRGDMNIDKNYTECLKDIL